MRKTFGILISASLALWVVGCGDDDGSCVGSCGEVDSGTTGSTSSGKTSATSGGGTTSTAATSSQSDPDAGSTNDADAGSTDAGVSTETPDGSLDASTDEPVDGGANTDAGDAAPEEGDAGDAAIALSPACTAACTTALEVGCADPSVCNVSVCGIEFDSPPGCEAEVNEYLECIGEADPETDFVCDDDAPMYIGAGCDDALSAWSECFNEQI